MLSLCIYLFLLTFVCHVHTLNSLQKYEDFVEHFDDVFLPTTVIITNFTNNYYCHGYTWSYTSCHTQYDDYGNNPTEVCSTQYYYSLTKLYQEFYKVIIVIDSDIINTEALNLTYNDDYNCTQNSTQKCIEYEFSTFPYSYKEDWYNFRDFYGSAEMCDTTIYPYPELLLTVPTVLNDTALFLCKFELNQNNFTQEIVSEIIDYCDRHVDLFEHKIVLQLPVYFAHPYSRSVMDLELFTLGNFTQNMIICTDDNCEHWQKLNDYVKCYYNLCPTPSPLPTVHEKQNDLIGWQIALIVIACIAFCICCICCFCWMRRNYDPNRLNTRNRSNVIHVTYAL